MSVAAKNLVAVATAAAVLSGCASVVVPEVGPVEDLIVGRLQSAIGEYCRKPNALRLAYRALAAEAAYPHAIKIECAKASVADPT